MRTWELVLVAADLVAFVVVVVPRLRRRTGLVAAVAPVAAVLQVLVEGARWQLVPAYLAALSLAVVPLASAGRRRPRRPGRPRRPRRPGRMARVGTVLAAGVGVVLLVASAAVPVAMPVFRFPEPAGPYGIGTTTYHWTDPSRPEAFTADPRDRRELMAQVWYPTTKRDTGRATRNDKAPYIEDAEHVTPVMARLFGFPEAAFAHFRYVTTNAVRDAPVAPGRHPALVFLSGLNGFRAVNTVQIEALAARGYVVVGLDQPGAVAAVRLPDGRTIPGLPRDRVQPLITQSLTPRDTPPTLHGLRLPAGIVPYLAADVRLALDRLAALNAADPHRLLTGRLDLARAGAFGVSLGAMTAAQACADDPRLRACLMMDAELPAHVVRAGLRGPALFITRDAATMRLERARFGGWSEGEIARTLGTMRAVFEGVAGPGYHLTIPGMFHLNFTDAPLWSPLTGRAGMTGPIAKERGFGLVNAYSVAFFDRHLRGRAAPLLDGGDRRFPEARLRVNPSDT